MRLLASLFAASVVLLALALRPACSPQSVQVGERTGLTNPQRVLLPWSPVRLECERPPALALRRFEDGSAWLLCADRILARVSVPR
jgi:hypothetical protein